MFGQYGERTERLIIRKNTGTSLWPTIDLEVEIFRLGVLRNHPTNAFNPPSYTKSPKLNGHYVE